MRLQSRDLVDKIKEVAQPYILSRGFELADMNYYYMGNRLVLRIFIDRPCGGITIDECALVNEELGGILDVSGILEQNYVLEVSSPGLDRALKTRDDFKRVINRRLTLFLNESIKGKSEIRGVLNKADEGFVYIESETEEFRIPYSKIVKAKQIIA